MLPADGAAQGTGAFGRDERRGRDPRRAARRHRRRRRPRPRVCVRDRRSAHVVASRRHDRRARRRRRRRVRGRGRDRPPAAARGRAANDDEIAPGGAPGRRAAASTRSCSTACSATSFSSDPLPTKRGGFGRVRLGLTSPLRRRRFSNPSTNIPFSAIEDRPRQPVRTDRADQRCGTGAQGYAVEPRRTADVEHRIGLARAEDLETAAALPASTPSGPTTKIVAECSPRVFRWARPSLAELRSRLASITNMVVASWFHRCRCGRRPPPLHGARRRQRRVGLRCRAPPVGVDDEPGDRFEAGEVLLRIRNDAHPVGGRIEVQPHVGAGERHAERRPDVHRSTGAALDHVHALTCS